MEEPKNVDAVIVPDASKIPRTYICDKKPGACKSWEKFGWNKCESEFCNRTTNKDHALLVGIDVKGETNG